MAGEINKIITKIPVYVVNAFFILMIIQITGSQFEVHFPKLTEICN